MESIILVLSFFVALSACLSDKSKDFAKDFRVGVILSFMIPISITATLTFLANILAGTNGLVFAILSIFAAVLFLSYIFFDMGNAIGKCGWNTDHLTNSEADLEDPNATYEFPKGLSKNNSTYLLHDGTFRQFDMDRYGRTPDSVADFYEVILNLVLSILLAFLVKTGIGSLIGVILTTIIMAAMFFKAYKYRQTRLNRAAKSASNPYFKKLREKRGQEIEDDLSKIQLLKLLSTAIRVIYLLILVIMWVLSNSLNLLWVQILTIFFLLLVISDLAMILTALSIRFKRFKPMDQDGYDIQDSDRNIRPADTEASA